MKRLTYVASPYSDDYSLIRYMRYKKACHTIALLMSRRVLAFSPIVANHPIAVYGQLPTDWDFWRVYDTAILECCKEMMVLTIDGWHKSKGVLAEIELAKRLGIPIIHIDEEGNPL